MAQVILAHNANPLVLDYFGIKREHYACVQYWALVANNSSAMYRCFVLLLWHLVDKRHGEMTSGLNEST